MDLIKGGSKAKVLGLVACLVAFSLLAMLGLQPTQANAHFWVKGGKKCRTVQHAPNSDWASSSIRVRGIGCRRARAWLGRNKGSWRGVPKGWKCIRRVKQSGDRWTGLGHTDYRCVKSGGRKKLVWINT